MAGIFVSQGAESDLADIWCYIAEQTGNHSSTQDVSSTADQLLDRIQNIFRSLSEHPLIGRTTSIHPDLRVFSAPPHLVFYRSAENGVEIVRVLHAARDITEDCFVGTESNS
jgi:toxin ParE1/3/4